MQQASRRLVARLSLLACLTLCIFPHPAAAQNLQGMKDRVEDLYAAGRYAESENAAKELLPLLEQRYGASHEAVMEVLDRLAWALYRQKRFEEAAQLHRRVLDVRRKTLSDKHALVAKSIDGLAKAYWELGRRDESKALSKQGIAALPPAFTMPGMAETVERGAAAERRAAALAGQGKLKEAEAAYREAVGAHKGVVTPAEEALADVLLRQGREREAFEIHQRMIAVWQGEERGFYGGHIFASNLTRLAKQYEAHGKLDKEAELLEMATAAREKALGASHPETLAGLADLGHSHERQGRKREAFQVFRRIADAERIRLAANAPDRQAAQSSSLRLSVFGSVIRVAHALALDDPSQAMSLSRQAFDAAQWGTISRAGTALTQMSARFGAGTGPLARLVRELQDTQQQWQALDRQLIDALGGSGAFAEETRRSELRAKLASAERTIADLQARVVKDHPRYAELSSPRPLGLELVQPLLQPDEALYFVYPLQEQTFAWTVTRDVLRWISIPLGLAGLAERVRDLRCGLDREGEWQWSEERKRWSALTPRCAKLRPSGLTRNEQPPFNLALAHDLYQLLFGQVAAQVRGKNLTVVATGPLATLPFQVLLTARPETSISNDPDELRRASWLATTAAVTVLPSVASLGSSRGAANDGVAQRPYVGVGNPLLVGTTGTDRSAWARQACAPLVPLAPRSGQRAPLRTGLDKLFRRGLANVEVLRLQRPLPESADELCAIAKTLGAGEEDVLLGARATEGALKQLSARRQLRSYRIVHFATHGLLAGETETMAHALAEPALMLTPPQAASEVDDGLLTASEIAQLDLNAEWVVLSACNTAAGETSDAEALSGLSRAFLYAGTRSLLVSHWYVDSYAAVALTTAAFAELAANPALPHAQAFRRAIISLITGNDTTASHPTFWAPFSVVGRRG